MSLAVTEFGSPDGRPVVMLHSLFFDGGMFDAVSAEWGDACRVIAPDHRGQGRSPRGGDLGMDALSVDVEDLLETLPTPVDLVGSSMGGYVAARVASRRPDLVSTLTLSCCTGGAEPDRARFDALAARLGVAGGAGHVDALERTMFGSEYLSRGLEDPVRARWRAHFAVLPADIEPATTAVFARAGMERELASLRMPLLLVAGELDAAKRPADMAAIQAIVPHGRLEVIDTAGHTPPVETPARFAALLTGFWADPSTAPRREQEVAV